MKNNYAFIDGQNLHLGTMEDNWKVDLKKFKVYLKDKYKVTNAYYFLGYLSEDQNELYLSLQEAGFIVVFKEHNSNQLGKKKGNVDTDIVFEIMKKIIEKEEFNKIVLVSGDGDYKKLVDYLIKRDVFEKILFPNKKFSSSLYKTLGSEYYDFMQNIKSYIEYKHGRKTK